MARPSQSLVDALAPRLDVVPTWSYWLFDLIVLVLMVKILQAILQHGIEGLLHKRGLPGRDRTAERFLIKVSNAGIWAMATLVALSWLNVDPAALLGGVAVSGFVIGFALKDTLGNLAAGVTLLLYRPFRIGETVILDTIEGKVLEIGLALTVLRTGDGNIVTLPNAMVLGRRIVNITREGAHRMEVLVGVAYGTDLTHARRVLMDVAQAHPEVLREPGPDVRVKLLADSAVNIELRAWAPADDHWRVEAELIGRTAEAFEAEGIQIPFPQRVIHHAS